MAVTKLSLYNDALVLLGQRRLATDTEDREPRYDLDTLYNDGGIDYCLEFVKPSYASTLLLLTGVPATGDTAYGFEVPLPADFITLDDDLTNNQAAVYRDGLEQSPITRWVKDGNNLLMDIQAPYIRYIKAHTDPQLTDIPPSFGRVISAYFARELAWKYDPDSEEQIDQKLQQRIEAAQGLDLRTSSTRRGFEPDVLTDELRYVYNDAFQLLQLPPISNNDDDSLRKNRISLTLQNGLVESVLEDTSWNFGLQSQQLFYNPSINPPWGYEYVHDLPADLLRFNGVYQDELMRTPIRDYVYQDNRIFSSYQIIYIEYVSTNFLTDYANWPAFFKRLVAARMAVDVNIPDADKTEAIEQYKNRRREAMSTNAINGPPKTLALGRWSRSRLYRGNMNRDRP